VLLIARSGPAAHDALQAAEAAGCPVGQTIAPADAADWFQNSLRADAILLELDERDQHSAKFYAPIEVYAKLRKVPILVSGPLTKVDEFSASLSGPNVTWLAEPSMADRVSALLMAIDLPGQSVRDISSDVDQQRLRRLADEVSRIARALSTLTDSETSNRSSYAASAVSDVQLSFRSEPAMPLDDIPMPSPEEVRRILRLRRLRENFFDPSLFADPAWDMLLDLMAARLERARVAVSSLCIAASVPPTTALRWIKAMTDHALFERCADPDDGRRIFIQLSDRAMQGMARYFEAAKKAGGLVI
jgi:DNA-binding MarR family transcriptional regulator